MNNEILRFRPEEVVKLFAEGKMESVNFPDTPIEKARKIFGQDFLGPEAVEKRFGIRIPSSEVPDIPFCPEELQRAKELNQFLILRLDMSPDGQPLTIKKVSQLVQRLTYSSQACGNEDFFAKDTPRAGWALVTKGFIPKSTYKNYLEQTQLLADYLKNQVLRDSNLPAEYQEAITEFNSQKTDIVNVISVGKLSNSWQEANKRLSALKLNQLTRQTPVEIIYDYCVYFKNNGQQSLNNAATWTSRLASDGYLVVIGYYDGIGWTFGRFSPVESQQAHIGAMFSRRS